MTIHVAAGANAEQTAHKDQPNGYAGLDAGSKLALSEFPATAVSSSALHPDLLAQVEPYSRPYTLYVNNQNGSDAALGNSPGQAFQTVAKAVQVLHQSGHGGEIVLIGVASGPYNIAAPLAFAVPVFIRAAVPSGATLQRTYTTPNSRSVWDAVTTATGASVSSANAAFTGADVNRIVEIYGAGVNGGTFYDFITSQAAPTATFGTATTAIARNTTTDPVGVKLRVLGDWNRVVTDAGINANTNVITSATATWTIADLGTEVIIAGAGQGHQALRGAIASISGNTATITAYASFTVSNQRCAIRVNLGTLLTWHGVSPPPAGGGQSGFRFLVITDTTGNSNAVGSAMDMYAPDMGSGSQANPADFVFEYSTLTSSGASGAWEHMLTCDGSWNQSVAGPGIRRATFTGCKVFGARTPGETIRLVSADHFDFFGNGIVGSAPTAFAQGYRILDPQQTAGFQRSATEVNFDGSEGLSSYFYCEGRYCSYIGGRLTADIATNMTGRRVVELSAASDHCLVVTVNASTLTGTNADEYDAGTNNRIETASLGGRLRVARALENSAPTNNNITYETISRRYYSAAANQTPGSSGVMILISIWLPGGFKVSKLGILGGTGTPIAWGSGWTGQHFLVGLYDPTGNLIAQTADTGGTQQIDTLAHAIIPVAKDGTGNVVSSVNTPLSGMCFLGLLIQSGTGGSAFTYPTFLGLSNGLISSSPALAGTSGSGLTALPPSITVPLTTGIASMLYGGVS